VILSFVLASGFAFSAHADAPAPAKFRVVASTSALADLARAVGGSDASVVSLARPSQDPHFVRVDRALGEPLAKADLLVFSGRELERGWLFSIVSNSGNAKIQVGAGGSLDASSLVEPAAAPGTPPEKNIGDDHPEGDPHYLLDPRNGMKVARGIAERLAKLDPTNADAYRKRADDYIGDLGGRIEQWERQLRSQRGRQIVTYHRGWSYFADWVGLVEVATLEPRPGVPPTPEDVVRLIHQMKEVRVRLVIVDTHDPQSTALHVAKESGARLLTLSAEVGSTPEARSYVSLFDADIKALLSSR
jgi:zinc/manganese transport system substrate-binding protein